MLSLFLWGIEREAQKKLDNISTLSAYDIKGFIDEDASKAGCTCRGYTVYAPTVLGEIQADRVILLSPSGDLDRIYHFIKEQYPYYADKVDTELFFYKQSLMCRYADTTDREINAVLNRVRTTGKLDVFNYFFTEKYNNMPVEISVDPDCGLIYTIYRGHRMYLPRAFSDRPENALNYIRGLYLEQDASSPHRYLQGDFDVEPGDVVIDAGVAEGNFSLDVIDRVSKLYLIEPDNRWLEALSRTMEPFGDKVEIIKAYANSYNEGEQRTLDSLIDEPVNFIKMDVEGFEWDALNGAEKLIARSPKLRMALCTYHGDYDATLLEYFMQQHGIDYKYSNGYMWFPQTTRNRTVSTRLVRGVMRCTK